MKCPIMIIGRMNSNDPRDISYTDCLKEECGWYIKDDGMCAVKKLTLEMRAAQQHLGSIGYRMPHEEQFRK